ncbi:LPXTG cell wall anchor domain-containing protein [Macrococcus bovicus]|uniref:LPXTG cell wall anchor domain-containing protein n=1 Tax=Macrococcus bovicus TaxID=69968 RepID=A0A4R6BVY9_9STAP|nr:LPXTG cell wall anchor domain-containing protein [Macrococcus bovicus]
MTGEEQSSSALMGSIALLTAGFTLLFIKRKRTDY